MKKTVLKREKSLKNYLFFPDVPLYHILSGCGVGRPSGKKERRMIPMSDRRLQFLKKVPIGTKIRFIDGKGKLVIATKIKFIRAGACVWSGNNNHYCNKRIPADFEVLPQ